MGRTSCNWQGDTFKAAKFTIIATFFLSLTCWALGIVYLVGANNSSQTSMPSQAAIYFHSCAIATASTIAAIVDYTLLHFGYLSPILAIVWSIIAAGAWLWSGVTWYFCEAPDYGCSIELYFELGDGAGAYTARNVFAFFVVVLYFLYLGIAARAIHHNRGKVQQQKSHEWNSGRRAAAVDAERGYLQKG